MPTCRLLTPRRLLPSPVGDIRLPLGSSNSVLTMSRCAASEAPGNGQPWRTCGALRRASRLSELTLFRESRQDGFPTELTWTTIANMDDLTLLRRRAAVIYRRLGK